MFQTPATFWSFNKNSLISAAGALVAILLASLGLDRRIADCGMRSTAEWRARPSRRGLIWRRLAGVALICAAAPLYAYTLRQSWHARPGLGQAWTLFGWIGLTFVGFVLLESKRRRSIVSDLRLNRGRRDWIYLSLFLFIWFICLAQRLDSRPGFFHGDEATVVMYGRSTYITSGGPQSPWRTIYAPFLAGVPRALTFEALRYHRPFLGPRLITLSLSAGALALIFIFARAYIGRLGAWIAVIIGATHHTWIAFSRMGILNIDGALLVTMIVFLWLCAFRSRRISLALLAGCLAGLSHYTYHGALVSLPVIACFSALDFLINPRRVFRRWPHFIFFALGLVMVTAPFRLTYRTDPWVATYRQSQVSMLTKVNFVNELNASGAQTIPAFLRRLAWTGVAGSLLWPDTSSNYDFQGFPIIDRTLLALFLAGFIASIPLWRRSRLLPILGVWVALTLVLGGSLSTTPPPPYAPRIFMMFPAMYLLAAWVLTSALRLTENLWGRAAAILPFLAGMVVIASSSVQNVKKYTNEYLANMRTPAYLATPTGMGLFLNKFPQDAHLVLCSPWLYQFSNACFQMYAGTYLQTTEADPAAQIPAPPDNPGGVAYAFKRPEFNEMEQRFSALHPEISPILIDNPHIDDPPMFAIYWLKPPPRSRAVSSEGAPAAK